MAAVHPPHVGVGRDELLEQLLSLEAVSPQETLAAEGVGQGVEASGRDEVEWCGEVFGEAVVEEVAVGGDVHEVPGVGIDDFPGPFHLGARCVLWQMQEQQVETARRHGLEAAVAAL